MSTGAIAMTAVILGGAQWAVIVAVVAWLVYSKRIMLAATPKPQTQQRDKDEAQDRAAPDAVRRLPA